MRHILCVYLPQWPIDRLRRRVGMRESNETKKPRGDEAMALVHTVASRRIVVHACRLAHKAGVRPGMPLAEARALCPTLRDHPYEPDKDLRSLRALARHLIRFSPTVGVAEDTGIFLDVTGCRQLYGSWVNLLEQVAEELDGLCFHHRLALAPTPGAAWALAAYGTRTPTPSPAQGQCADVNISANLAPLPVEALRLDPQIITTLHHLGIETIGQLLAIPRSQLPSRFGPQLLLRIDQALGLVPEPIVPLRPATPIDARIDFDGVTDSLETILHAIDILINRICADLARLGRGVRRIDLRLHRLYADAVTREVLFSRPSRNRNSLFRLLSAAVEMMDLKCKSSNRSDHATKRPSVLEKRLRREPVLESDGFSAISLHVLLSEPVADEQFSFDNHAEETGRIHIGRLIENLTLRLGESAIARAQLVESHLPERAFTFQLDTPCSPSAFSPQHPAFSLRPLLLYPRPIELRVLVAPSHDREGRPVSFSLGRENHRVVHAIGPERIAGLWWERHCRTRDYFFIEDDSSHRWWIFRVRESHRWFLHGEFA